MTHRAASTGSVGVVLPADWHVVDLTTDATRHAGVTSLVDRQLPRRDDLAAVRRRLRREVEGSSHRAAQAGGRFSAYMLTTAGPVPLPVVLTAYRAPGSFAADADLDALATTLAQRLGAAGTVDVGTCPLGPVLRTVTVRRDDATGSELLLSDYWSDPADGDGLLVLSFSTPLVPLRDALVELFDTITGSLHRTATARAATQSQGEPRATEPDPSEQDENEWAERRRSDQYAMLAATAVDLDDEEDVERASVRLRAARRVVAARRRTDGPTD